MRSIRLFLLLVPFALAGCGNDDPSVATGPEPYPLEVCLVSGERLGSMGEPVVIVHAGREIKFCCDDCVPKFDKDPEKYLRKLEQGGGTQAGSGHADGDH